VIRRFAFLLAARSLKDGTKVAGQIFASLRTLAGFAFDAIERQDL